MLSKEIWKPPAMALVFSLQRGTQARAGAHGSTLVVAGRRRGSTGSHRNDYCFNHTVSSPHFRLRWQIHSSLPAPPPHRFPCKHDPRLANKQSAGSASLGAWRARLGLKRARSEVLSISLAGLSVSITTLAGGLPGAFLP